MSKLRFFLLSTVLVLTGCNLDFLTKSNDTTAITENLKYTWNADRTLCTCYNSKDVKQWSETYAYVAGSDRVSKMQHYSAADILLYSRLYSYNADNLKELEAEYNDAGSLSYFNHFTYTNKLLTQQNSYNGASELQTFETFAYTPAVSDPAVNNLTLFAQFDANAALKTAVKKTFDDKNNLTSTSIFKTVSGAATLVEKTEAKWSTQGKYKETVFKVGTTPETLPAGVFASSVAESPTRAGVAALVLPVIPSAPTAPALTLTDLSLPVYTTTWWVYDGFGNTQISLNSWLFPISAVRTDSNLSKPIKIDLAYDTSKRVIKKTTSYGTTKALEIGLTYNANGFVSQIDASGESLYLPLSCQLTYNDYNFPLTIKMLSNGASLISLSYEYDTTVTQTKATSNAGTGFELIRFAGKPLAIHQIDGDGKAVADYVFTYDLNGVAGDLKLDVVNPADKKSNGAYILYHDLDGKTTGFKSVDKDAKTLWDYNYSYSALQDNVTQKIFETQSNLTTLVDKGLKMDPLQVLLPLIVQ